MKTLDFNEMENVNGGILCADIPAVIDYLYEHEHFGQGDIVLMAYLAHEIQCD